MTGLREYKKYTVTAVLILLNVLVFLVVELTGSSEDPGHMLRCGAAFGPLILEEGEYYRIVTCMFLHFGMRHLLNNMLVLGVLGERLEPAAGHVRYALIYLLSGIGGNLISLAISTRTAENAVSAGASGAVFGLMGAILYLVLRNRGRFADLSLRRMAVMIAFSVYLGFADGGVDNAAHLGGLFCGFVLAFLLCRGFTRR